MPTCISLVRYTQKGIEAIKDSPTRLEAAKKAAVAAGGRALAFYLTMGQYDGVLIGEFPDDETAARAALAGGAQGYARAETLRAFTEEEFRELVASLP